MGKLHETRESFENSAEVGDWAFSSDNVHIFIETPTGTAILQIDPTAYPEHKRACWQWDGNREAPTLTPSILLHSKPKEWHGWLRDGKLVEA